MIDEFDRKLDRAIDEPFAQNQPPSILYHYTTWVGFESILRDRSFRATAHGSTNDPKELRAVDKLACQIADRLGGTLGSAVAEVMTRFSTRFPTRTLSDLTTIFLSCFSSARDEAIHWNEYAQGGIGVCIGLKVLRSEALLEEPDLGRAIMQVDYDRASWEAKIERGFRNVAAVYQWFRDEPGPEADIHRARELATAALARVTGLAAIAAKEARWRGEQEWRYTAIARRGAKIQPAFYWRDDCTKVPYLLPPMRAAGRLLVLDEVIIGSKETQATAEARALEILARAGYPSPDGDAPVPRISRSRAAVA